MYVLIVAQYGASVNFAIVICVWIMYVLIVAQYGASVNCVLL